MKIRPFPRLSPRNPDGGGCGRGPPESAAPARPSGELGDSLRKNGGRVGRPGLRPVKRGPRPPRGVGGSLPDLREL